MHEHVEPIPKLTLLISGVTFILAAGLLGYILYILF